MRKGFYVMLAVAVLLVSSALAGFAGGGQNCIMNRGLLGEGAVNQHQVNANASWIITP